MQIRRRDEDGRRDALVAAAGRVIARDGVGAATTRKIAAEAGLPLGMVHYWFGGKDDLLAAVVEKAVADLEAASHETPFFRGTGDLDLRDAFRAAWEFIVNDEPGRQLSLYELTIVALRTQGMEKLAAKQYASYRGVATATAQPWFEAYGGELPGGLEALARLIAVTIDGAALAWLADPEGTRPHEIFELLSFLLDRART
ncbi:TetR/AcrR family transcriptional regulator [Nocardioides sp. Kera G14]|uniref:TetR/AcrR family transcriptional regulator n=1 Tax=Nocardioides sp. Kera G14 TaxID=2884264 RepID=UPI001D0F8AF3|nr:TetR family transcriptional regulator [Nocardioides sp. Kera G14]UDY25350.1 TetR family transcriptional regulator [Nocardioides sp. Kera G14]